MAIREIDETTGMPYEDNPEFGISSGDSREEETAEEMEDRIRAEMMTAAMVTATNKPPEAEPKRETREEMEARIRAEIQGQAPPQSVNVGSSNGAKPPLSEQAAAPRRGRPPKAAAEARATAATETGSAVQRSDAGGQVQVEPLAELFERDAEKGVSFEARDITIPRLNLLQDNSPEVKERLAEYVEGARPGLWLNTVTRDLMAAPLIVPVSYTRRFVGWYPRQANGAGGGLARMDVPEEEFLQYEETGIGIRSYTAEIVQRGQKLQKVVDVVDTPEWVVLLLGAAGVRPQACAISFPRTKAKAAGQMNTIISMQVITRKDGTEYTPASFSNVFRLGSMSDGEGVDSYFVPTVEHVGRVTKAEIYERAAKLFEQFGAGRVKVMADAQE